MEILLTEKLCEENNFAADPENSNFKNSSCFIVLSVAMIFIVK